MSRLASCSQPDAHFSQSQRAEQFALLVERATDFAIFLLDAEGKIATWNDGARRILGYDETEILGQTTHCLYTTEDVAQGVPEHQLQIAREQGSAINERWQTKKDGSRYFSSGIDQALREADGTLRGYSIIFRDRTVQKQVEEALRFSEERYRGIVESVTEYAIFTLDAQGCVSEWNTGAERILGYREEDILGQSASLLFTPEDVAKGQDRKEMQQAAREGRADDERWHLKQDGSRFWATGVLMRMEGGEQPRFVKVLRDMTDGKQAEEQRRRLEHATTLLQERTRMAQELHDTLAQGFVGIAMQLEAAKGMLRSAPEEAERHFSRAVTLARESLTEARRSVQALRPTLLQTNTLAEALALLVVQVTAGTSVAPEFAQKGQARLLPPTMEEDLLRVSQEAITNALRHGRPAHIRVELTFAADAVQLKVQDNGQGFDALTPTPSGHYGLVGMRERAERLGGTLTLCSVVGQGTEVSLVVPTLAAKSL